MFDFSWFPVSWQSGRVLQHLLSSGADPLDVKAFAVLCGALAAMVVGVAMQFSEGFSLWGRLKPQLIVSAMVVPPLAHYLGGLTLLTAGLVVLALNLMMAYLCANFERTQREIDAYWKAAGYVHGLAARQSCSK